jgi:hypothetical protein
MSTQYRLVQSGKTASGCCSAGQGSSEPVAPRIYLFYYLLLYMWRFPMKKLIRKTQEACCIVLSFSACRSLAQVTATDEIGRVWTVLRI